MKNLDLRYLSSNHYFSFKILILKNLMIPSPSNVSSTVQVDADASAHMMTSKSQAMKNIAQWNLPWQQSSVQGILSF